MSKDRIKWLSSILKRDKPIVPARKNRYKYYSNCLLESLKAWIKSPLHISIHKKGSLKTLLRKGKMFHFYWKDKRTGKIYDFTKDKMDYPKDTLMNQIWFKGFKREVKQGT
jgi:hypothetical protein